MVKGNLLPWGLFSVREEGGGGGGGGGGGEGGRGGEGGGREEGGGGGGGEKKRGEAARPATPVHYGTKLGHFETSKIHFPTSEGVSEQANK